MPRPVWSAVKFVDSRVHVRDFGQMMRAVTQTYIACACLLGLLRAAGEGAGVAVVRGSGVSQSLPFSLALSLLPYLHRSHAKRCAVILGEHAGASAGVGGDSRRHPPGRRPSHAPLEALRGGGRIDSGTTTAEWASLLGMGGRRKIRRGTGKGASSTVAEPAIMGTDGTGPVDVSDAISQEIAVKEKEMQSLLQDLVQGQAGAGPKPPGSASAKHGEDMHGDSDSAEEVDLAVHLAPLTKDELQQLIAKLVAGHPEIGERVLEFAHEPFDIAAIPYRVEQLKVARAAPEEFVYEMEPLAQKALAYAMSHDLANARSMAEALTRSIGSGKP